MGDYEIHADSCMTGEEKVQYKTEQDRNNLLLTLQNILAIAERPKQSYTTDSGRLDLIKELAKKALDDTPFGGTKPENVSFGIPDWCI